MLYKEEFDWRPTLDHITFSVLDEASRLDIERRFYEDEILQGLRACKKDKTLGLSNFNMRFLQEFMHAMKSDIIELFNELY